METQIVYFDESGDDGVKERSSDIFILSSLYMKSEDWQNNYDIIKACRKHMYREFGFHISEELHTKHLLTDKKPYRDYKWSPETRYEIIATFCNCINKLSAKSVNVIIDKEAIKNSDYLVLDNALTYNIQRIENDSYKSGCWNYIMITDRGRVGVMRKKARAIRTYNPIPSQYTLDHTNIPISGMIGDILEKDSNESYFIQVCDYISYIVCLYYNNQIKSLALPNRVSLVLDSTKLIGLMNKMKESGLLNLKASHKNDYGLVIYPKK